MKENINILRLKIIFKTTDSVSTVRSPPEMSVHINQTFCITAVAAHDEVR